MYCIYRITNLINGKTYIGQHGYKETPYDSYMGSGVTLHKAYRKYDIENFKKDILVFNVSKKEHIDLLEKTFIASEREKVGKENCYNIADGGEGRTGPLSEETRKRMSKAQKGNQNSKGKHPSEEARKKMSEAHKNKPHSAEWVKKVAEANKGKKRSKESLERMSKAQKGNQNCKGRHLSEETKKKISEALKKKKLEKDNK